MINKRQAGLALATLVLSLSAVGTALAQSYPDKPIRLVVPYPPAPPPTQWAASSVRSSRPTSARP